MIENLVGMVFSLRGVPVDLPFTPHGKHRRARQALDEFVYGLIARRRDPTPIME